MRASQRHLGIALLVTLAATWWTSGLREEDAADAAGPSPPTDTRKPAHTDAGARRQRGGTALTAPAPARERRPLPTLRQDPFGLASFQPPAPKSAAPPPPPPPSAPPLRFVYLGLLNEGDRLAVFLNDGAQLLIARSGEILAGQYRVEQITERSMTLEYMPLGQKQILQFGRQ